ncbi:hypothetical protein J8M20_24810, partial [Pseudoalteromonas luteoviolacea]|uniref:hypothetical protein n=1 Tax=Pseudoalteromonas luteoviolacea TaxID=43657 RepID=UPI001B362F7E
SETHSLLSFFMPFKYTPLTAVKTAHFTLREKSALTAFAVANLLHLSYVKETHSLRSPSLTLYTMFTVVNLLYFP